MDKPTGSPVVGAKQKIEKQARQLAYDTRYKVKQAMKATSGSRLDPASVSKAYMAQLGKSSAPPAVKARARQMLLGEDLIDVQKLAEQSLADALHKVFVEGVTFEEEVQVQEETTGVKERKYSVRVTDKETGNSYVTNATRKKIAELRANPNISSVEMTQYGKPSESEKTKGANTASVKAGKGLKNDGNLANNYPPYDKVTRGDVIAGATGKDQMGGKRKVKEEFIGEVNQDPESKKKITGKGVNNYKSKSVKVFPEVSEQMKPSEQEKSAQPVQQKTQTKGQDIKDRQTSQALDRTRQQEVQILQRKLQALRSAPKGTDPSIMASYEPDGDDIQEVAPPGMESTVKKMKKHPELTRGKTKEGKQKNVYALAWYMYNKKKGVKEEVEGEMDKEPELKKSEGGIEDPREIPTKVNLVKNKFRAMGLKMSYEPEGEVIGESERREEEQRTYGVGGNPNNPRPERPASAPTGPKKKPAAPDAAFKSVVASLRAQHGPNAVMASMRTRKGGQG